MCDAIIKTGTRKGLVCKKPATRSDGKCGNHTKNKGKTKAAPANRISASLDTLQKPYATDEDTVEIVEEQFAKPKQPVIITKGTSAKRRVDTVHLSDGKTYVCNVKHSSKDTGNWKTFWLKHSGTVTYPKTCRAKDCERKATATGHMYLRDDQENKKYNYLVPICAHHNSSKYDSTYFLVKKSTVAVKIHENKDIHH